nr:hypothetical protein [Pseudomonadales bacterium]
MPEWAEVRITRDFINHVADGRMVEYLRFSPYLKLKNLSQQPTPFTLSAQSRGKELALHFELASPSPAL